MAAELGLLLILVLAPPLARVIGLGGSRSPSGGGLLCSPPTMNLFEESRECLARRGRTMRETPSSAVPAVRVGHSPDRPAARVAGTR